MRMTEDRNPAFVNYEPRPELRKRRRRSTVRKLLVAAEELRLAMADIAWGWIAHLKDQWVMRCW